MGIHTDNARIREKIERLARLMGTDEESALEAMLDEQLSTRSSPPPDFDKVSPERKEERLQGARRILAEIDRLPRLPPDQQFEALEWDEIGLPK